MKPQTPWLSIVTVVFNDVERIKYTLESISRCNKLEDIEYIIVDGGSADGTLEEVNQYSHLIDILISEKDDGIYDAMNKGFVKSSGKYMLFLNSGDEIHNPDLIKDLKELGEEPDVIYSETVLVDVQRNELGTRSDLTSRKVPKELSSSSFLKGMVVSHQSFIAKRSLAEYYNLKYKCSADQDWCITILKKAKRIEKLNKPISKYEVGGYSLQNLETCWSERFEIYSKHFGVFPTLGQHLRLGFNYLWMKITKKPIY